MEKKLKPLSRKAFEKARANRQNGTTIKELANARGCSESAYMYLYKAAESEYGKWDNMDKAKIACLMRAGWKIKDIAREVGLSTENMNTYLKANSEEIASITKLEREYNETDGICGKYKPNGKKGYKCSNCLNKAKCMGGSKDDV